jgi:hypothetical protein
MGNYLFENIIVICHAAKIQKFWELVILAILKKFQKNSFINNK